MVDYFKLAVNEMQLDFARKIYYVQQNIKIGN